MPREKKTADKKRSKESPVSEMESLKTIAALDKEINKLKSKHEKAHTQWLGKLKKQIEKGATQIKQMKERVKKAKTASTRNNIAMNLKAIHQKQVELKAELRQLSKQHKKLVAEERCLKRFEKDYDKLETKKLKAKKASKRATSQTVKKKPQPRETIETTEKRPLEEDN